MQEAMNRAGWLRRFWGAFLQEKSGAVFSWEICEISPPLGIHFSSFNTCGRVESHRVLCAERLLKTKLGVNSFPVELFHQHVAIDGSRDAEELGRLYPILKPSRPALGVFCGIIAGCFRGYPLADRTLERRVLQPKDS